ncbi:DNA cytosine methyltransferase [Allofournierella sp.]|uniref:DNA cytosine methyltransferase n=1 Tax=Allofournierella sp. TaxID=1940256 RepID=UPI003AEF63A1
MRLSKSKVKAKAQINLLDEIIVDGFAGGGGWSTGIEQATGTPVDVAINHDPDAVLMHQTNHPYTEHYCESIFDVSPAKATRGRPVGWAHFSPDCKHFSKAKGGKPVDKKIRGLAWVVVRWALEVSPRILSLENVEEFKTWGPLALMDGKSYPDPDRRGEFFRAFIGMLTDGSAITADALAECCEALEWQPDGLEAARVTAGLGYKVEWRELVAADYGAPTTRRRLFIIARRDGRPIVWPEANHAPADSPAARSGKKLPWRSAAEIIDWSLPCPSIFESKASIRQQYGLTAVRPLADNTMRRVMCGVDKFVLRSGRPFLVPIGYGERQGQAPRIHSVDAPLPTAVSGIKHYACTPKLAPLTMHNNTGAAARPASDPVSTITTGGQQMMIAPTLIQYHTEQGTEAVRAQSPNAPICTIDTANRHAIAAPLLVEYYGTGQAQQVAAPLHTIVTKDREALAVPFLSKYFGGVVGTTVDKPAPTTTAVDHNALCKVKLCKAEPGANLGHWPEVRAALNRWCGYTLADNDLLLIEIAGVNYYITDIGLRMLTARELYNANGFPPDYIIDRDYTGKPYSKSKQVARCGNAVPPPFAVALVRANWPERCKGVHIDTMSQLMEQIAI